MYRDERHKLVSYHGLDYGELYDLERAPLELANLWEAPAAAPTRQAHPKKLRRHGHRLRPRPRPNRPLLSAFDRRRWPLLPRRPVAQPGTTDLTISSYHGLMKYTPTGRTSGAASTSAGRGHAALRHRPAPAAARHTG